MNECMEIKKISLCTVAPAVLVALTQAQSDLRESAAAVSQTLLMPVTFLLSVLSQQSALCGHRSSLRDSRMSLTAGDTAAYCCEVTELLLQQLMLLLADSANSAETQVKSDGPHIF